MIKLSQLKFIRESMCEKYDLDLNYDSVPYPANALLQPKYPFNHIPPDVSEEAFKALDIWWELDRLIKELEQQKAMYGAITVILREFVNANLEEEQT